MGVGESPQWARHLRRNGPVEKNFPWVLRPGAFSTVHKASIKAKFKILTGADFAQLLFKVLLNKISKPSKIREMAPSHDDNPLCMSPR